MELLDQGPPLSIGMLSTYPPTQCGLATFSAALWQHLAARPGGASVIRVVERPETHPGAEVVAHLVNGSRASAAAAVETLNGHDVVLVQHEYGIYGGPDGADVVELVEALTVPVIVVLHTVLQEPTWRQRRVLDRLIAAADLLVTMTDTGRQRLLDHYAVDPSQAVVIPHGAVGPPPLALRRQAKRPVVLTWGLLGPGKGIEHVIDALPALRDLDPRYVVLGKTHPKVLEHEGEAYRESLQRRAARYGVMDLLELDDRYLTTAELATLIDQAAVVLLPYDSREQVTSGVLVEAVAAGRPVISTAFPHAVELLAKGLGLVVPQGDSGAIERSVRRVLTDPSLASDMAARSVRKAPELLWGAVARCYRARAEQLVAELAAVS